MANPKPTTILLLLLLTYLQAITVRGQSYGAPDDDEAKIKVTLKNKCEFPVWPGIYPGLDVITEDLKPKLEMEPDQSKTLSINPWKADIYIWGRTECTVNSSKSSSASASYFAAPPKLCLTGECASAAGFRCLFGSREGPPVSTAFFKQANYSVDISRGYNLPLSVEAVSVLGEEEEKDDKRHESKCRVMGCGKAVKELCPEELQVRSRKKVVACAPVSDDEDSANAYEKVVKKCPCTHPMAAPQSSPVRVQGYTVTFCPRSHKSKD